MGSRKKFCGYECVLIIVALMEVLINWSRNSINSNEIGIVNHLERVTIEKITYSLIELKAY